MTKTLMQLLKWPALRSSHNCRRRGDQRLLKITEVDDYLRSNPYIVTGYRDKLGLYACLKSLLSFHNETVNIWTHLIGFVIFVGLLAWDVFLVIPQLRSDAVGTSDILVLVGIVVCYQACMFLSSVYHTFCCHSRTVSEKCLSLDLAGITLALLATYLSGVYYSFFCLPGWRDFYLITVAGIFVVAALAQLWPRFASYYWLRLSLFCAWAAYGVVPTAHFVVLNGGLGSSLVPVILPRVVAMYAITGLAFVFYVFKMPERFFPGLVDIIGHSHQWWHFFIFLALLFWHHSGVVWATFRADTGCAAAPSEDAIDRMRMWPF